MLCFPEVFQQIMTGIVACEQTHLYKFGENFGRRSLRQVRRMGRGKVSLHESYTDFWIPRVRWRTQRSNWLKVTGVDVTKTMDTPNKYSHIKSNDKKSW